MTTIETMTDEQIESLSAEAGEHGDTEQVRLCSLALDGDDAARIACLKAINYAETQAEC